MFAANAQEAGVSPSEYLRSLIVGTIPSAGEILDRVARMERRLEHVESEVAEMWRQEGRHGQEVR